MEAPKSMTDVKALYDKGVNIMKLFRDLESETSNSLRAILVSYDMQAGSYVEYLSDPNHMDFVDNYTKAIARILDQMNCHSVLEAGVGEATTLTNVAMRMDTMPNAVLGFDLSWSRIAYAKEYAKSKNVNASLFVGNLLEIPILSDSVDVVYTSHSIEPNRGKEKEIMSELYRIARRYLVLLEPSNELGSEQTKKRIEEHKYCKDLYQHAKELNLIVTEYRLFEYTSNPSNQTALMVVEKGLGEQPDQQDYFACPVCKNLLKFHCGNYYCQNCFVVYPVIGDIPCLVSSHGILASKYMEKT